MNPQYQEKIVYPPTFVTGKAYVDQLACTNALAPVKATALIAATIRRQRS